MKYLSRAAKTALIAVAVVVVMAVAGIVYAATRPEPASPVASPTEGHVPGVPDPVRVTSPSTPVATPPIDPEHRGLFDAKEDEIVTSTASALFTFDTRVDTGPADVAARAAGWFIDGAAPETIIGPWATDDGWAALGDATTATLVDLSDATEAGAPQSPSEAMKRYVATVELNDGTTITQRDVIFDITLKRLPDGVYWRASQIREM